MHYLLQVNFYLIIFYAFYHFFLRRETFYQANRFYLMVTGVMAFVIPFLQSELVKSWFVTQEVGMIMSTYQLDGLEVYVKEGLEITFKDVLLFLYTAGMLYFTVVFGLQVWNTLGLFKRPEHEDMAFSFMGKVRVGQNFSAYPAVLAHERAHIQQCHSFDVILFEVISILCWMNPITYFLKREIRLLHEYQADAVAAKMTGSKAMYAALLVSKKFGVSPDILLSSAFLKSSFLKARLEMLGKESSQKQALLKYGLIAPVFLAMMVFASASIASPLEVIVILAEQKPRATKEVKIDLSDYAKDGTIHGVEDGEDLSLGQNLPPEPAPAVSEIALQSKKTPSPALPVEIRLAPEFLEVNPTYPGGESAMYRFLSEEISYPSAASKANVQGRVVVQFVVEKDGSISEPSILKGIGFGADEEALRVVAKMPKWNPGKQNGENIRVKYTIPILFSISD
jgi:TonB family protein